MRTKAFHSIVKTCCSTSHVRRHDGLLYNCDVRSCKGGSLASRPERLVPNRLKPGNSRMGPSSAREFAGITHLRCSDSLRSLLSHFPIQLKLGKIRRSPGERCHPARRATGDPLGRLDSVAAGEGANAVSVAWDPTRYVLMDLAAEISQ